MQAARRTSPALRPRARPEGNRKQQRQLSRILRRSEQRERFQRAAGALDPTPEKIKGGIITDPKANKTFWQSVGKLKKEPEKLNLNGLELPELDGLEVQALDDLKELEGIPELEELPELKI